MKKKLGMSLLILGIALTSGCSLANNKINNEENQHVQTENEIMKDGEVVNINDQNIINIENNKTEDKNKYRNNEFGFEFVGPEEFIVEINDGISFIKPASRSFSIDNNKNCSDNNPETICCPSCNEISFTIKILGNKSECLNGGEIENVSINGIEWERCIVPAIGYDTYFETKYNNKYYLIRFFINEEEIAAILESFNFIN